MFVYEAHITLAVGTNSKNIKGDDDSSVIFLLLFIGLQATPAY